MIEFVFTTILMFCLLAVLYLMVRALPRIEEVPAAEQSQPYGFLDRWAHSEIPEKIDIALNGFLFKFLRKIKVFILKFDNNLGSQLQKMKAKEDEHERKSAISFKEIAEDGAAERRADDRRRFRRRATDQTLGNENSPEI
jgi:hypothetical protein